MTREQLEQEIKARYPIGCTVECLQVSSDEGIVEDYDFTDEDKWDFTDDEVWFVLEKDNAIKLYHNRTDIPSWAKILTYPDPTIQLYPLNFTL
jgi:hypothetical protein